jgi:hypothetical protein
MLTATLATCTSCNGRPVLGEVAVIAESAIAVHVDEETEEPDCRDSGTVTEAIRLQSLLMFVGPWL